jgi:3-oxoacyl-[acyl-carrier-protein] synthase II
MKPARIVITGADVISPLGTSWADTVAALREGKSGIRPISLFDTSQLPAHVAGEIRACLSREIHERSSEMLQSTVSAAVAQSGIQFDQSRVGLAIGVGRQHRCSLPTAIDQGSTHCTTRVDNAPWHLSRTLGCSGPTYICTTACASGVDAIGLGIRVLCRGAADVMVCGAVDSQLTPLSLIELGLLGVLSACEGHLRAPKPFDKHRDGMVVGEGCAVFILETLEHASNRAADILGEVRGYGASLSAYSVTRERPDGSGAVRAIRSALAHAELLPEDIDYINAHGTATIANDRTETVAIKHVFGTRAKCIPVSSTKAMTGHALAASGAIEVAFCLMALENQFVPPTINYDTPDSECDLDYVPNTARDMPLRAVLSNSFGFGGYNSAIVLTRCP